MTKRLIITCTMLLWAITTFAQSPLWMRYPAISLDGKYIAFAYMGDIYKVDANGGTAQRLTTLPSFESNPVWSATGAQIAFISDRNSSKDIYIMNADGGKAKQLTFNSANETPYTFTPDNKYIVFSAHYQDPVKSVLFPNSVFSEVYKVNIEGGAPELILASPAENIKFSKDGQNMIYQDRKGFENTWRKHHTSSVTRNILEYNFSNKNHKELVNWKGEDTDPNYSNDEKTIYFLSERSGSYNVFSAPIDNANQAKQLTNFKDNPVRFLSVANDGKLAFGYNGEIYVMQNESAEPQKLNIVINNDLSDEQIKRMVLTSGATSAANSPDGTQVAFSVRGDVFVTSADYTTTKRITTSIAEETDVNFSSDNRTLAYSSYRDGYWNVYIAKISRKEDLNFSNATLIDEKPLIEKDTNEKQNPKFSPDGEEIAFVENRKKLMVYNIKSKQLRQITDGSMQQESDGNITYEWSPDGKWFVLEYVSNNHAPYSNIGIVSSSGKEKIFNITNSGYFNQNPKWVMNGNAILFNSEMYGMRNHASWGSMQDVMIVFLNREAFNKYNMNKEDFELFNENEKKTKNEEQEKVKETEKKDKNKKKDEPNKEKDKPILIEFDNIEDRMVRLTPNSSNLGDAILDKDGTKLYYLSAIEKGYDMWVYDLREKSTKLLNKLNSNWSKLSTDKDHKKLFILNSQKMKIMEFSNDKMKNIDYKAETKIDLAKEREFMFNYMYREEKERFYDVAMHNVDWEMLTANYRRFLPYINNNYDFAEMLSELLGELNVSHTGSGYRYSGTNEKTAELGIFSHRESNKKGLVVDEIIVNGPFDSFLSKLSKGDIIEKIDGNEIDELTDYYQFLNGKIGKNTLISIYSPASDKRWDETIKPISDGTLSQLLYNRWVKQREAEVDSLSNGRLGYVHIPSMGDNSFRQIYSNVMGKYYQKEGIVIDIRYNGGGRLHEDLEVFFSGKKYLQQTVRGKDYCEMPSRRWNKPSIMLMCEMDYSNAHGSPWVYKHMGIGKLVGMPVPGTMTSVNWVTLQDPTLYFGIPAVGYKTDEGIYLENLQLEPDVTAPLNLVKSIDGEDSQLETAVKELLKELK